MLRVNQLTGFWYSPSDLDFLGGAALILGEAAGMGIDFTYHTDINKQVKIRGTGAYYGSAYGKLTYTSPSLKLCRQSDGVWRYGNHNLLIRSQEFDNASWGTFGAVSKGTANATVAPDGTTTADEISFTGGYGEINLATTTPAGTWRLSVWAKRNAGSNQTFRLKFNSGGNTYSSDLTATSSWQRFTFELAVSANFAIAISSDAADNVSALYLWGAEVKRTPVNDAGGFTPATGYLATTTTAVYDLPYEWNAALASQGILIEEARTNLLVQSQDFTTTWSPSGNIVKTADATTAPDGTTTADKLAAANNIAEHGFGQTGLTFSAATYTFSVFAKAAGFSWFQVDFYDGTSRRTWFDVTNGVVGTNAAGSTSTISDAGNGWWRCTISRTQSATGSGQVGIVITNADNVLSMTGNGTDGVYLWNAQVELGSFATSPIHTVAASITRAKDDLQMATSLFPHSDAAGTLVVAGMIPRTPSLGTYKILTILHDNTFNENHHLVVSDGEIDVTYQCIDGGADQGALSPIGNVSANNQFRAGYAYAVNDRAAVTDGGVVVPDLTATMPTCTTLSFGQYSNETFQLNGYLQQLTYLPRRATNSELQTRTNNGPGASDLLLGEADGMTFDFLYAADVNRQLRIKDNTTPANNFHGAPRPKLTYTSPSVKLTRQSDGVWRYGNHNLCLQSQTLETSWTISASTLASNNTTAPDGTSTADKITGTGSGEFISQAAALTVVATHKMTSIVYVKRDNFDWFRFRVYDAAGVNGCTGWFNLNTGATGTASNQGSGHTVDSISISGPVNGFYRCVVNFTCVTTDLSWRLSSASADASATRADVGSGAGVGTIYYVWGAQIKRLPVNDAGGYTYATGYLPTTTAAVYDLPYEWSAALASQGILIEEQRTNSHLYNQDLTDAGWIKNASTISANATTAPDGTTTADKVQESNATDWHGCYRQINGTAVAWTWSIFVKAVERTFITLQFTTGGVDSGVCFNLGTGAVGTTTGTITSSSITAEANGWYRISITKTLTAATWYLVASFGTADGAPQESYLGVTGNGVHLWGSQAEAGAFPTSPIHTIAATVTRARDDIKILTSAMPFSTTAGTIIGNTLLPTLVVSKRTNWALHDGGFNEYIEVSHRNVADQRSVALILDGGASQFADNASPNPTAGVQHKAGFAWTANDAALVAAGGTPATDATVTLPTVTTLQFGVAINTEVLNGYIRQLTYLPRRATNVELQAKTS